ncbi:hypothetical protein FI667_g3188, partial [Globisporangium splendens]
MSGQDVFKGALGWDDWVWWSIIGGVGLFILLTLLCCCVCVQRAKRKGRAEALASVQARQREAQQREEAQVRYAQAQQARYGAPAPPQEQSFKYSQQNGGAGAGGPPPAQYVPPQKKAYGPQVKANAYAMPPPQQYDQYGQPVYGHPQQQSYTQPSPYGQQHQYGQHVPPPQQQYAAPAQHQQQYAAPAPQQQQQYAAVPQQQQQYAPAPQQQQQYAAVPKQQPAGYYEQQAPPPAAAAPQQQDQYKRPYTKPKPWHAAAAKAAPASPVAAYPESLAGFSDDGDHRSGLHDHDFVAVTSPMGRDPTLSASTVSKMTLRDRIDALREGSVHDNHSRVSADAQDLEAPPIGAGRRSLVVAGTVLSENSPASSASSSPRKQKADEERSLLHKTPHQVAFEEQAKFKTARSDYSSDDDNDHSKLASTSYSTGQFDDAESARVHQTAATTNASSYNVDSTTQTAARARVKSSESTSSRGSVEF